MHNEELISDELAAAVRSGEVNGSDALGDIDNKLISDDMTAEAAAFTDWYYDRYLEDYSAAFPDHSDYGVPDDEQSFDKIGPVLDGRLHEWIESGRPVSTRTAPEIDPAIFEGATIGLPPREEWEYFDADTREELEKQLAAGEAFGMPAFEMRPPPTPHKRPELEALLPGELGEASSVTLASWGAPMIKRALKRMDVSPRDAYIANVLTPIPGRRGALMVSLYSVPGVSGEHLDDEFRAAFKQPRTVLVSEEDRIVAGRSVHWQHAQEWISAWWCRDGLVVHASAPDETFLEELIAKLP